MYQIVKLRKKLEILYQKRFMDTIQIKEIGISAPTDDATELEEAIGYDYAPFRVGDTFVGRDQYYWLKVDVEIPEAFHGQQVIGKFDIGRTGLWFESGMEALLYVDGKPFQGVDCNHKEVIFHTYNKDWRTFYLQVWSGLEGGGKPVEQVHTFKEVSFSIYDEGHNTYYLHLKHLFEAMDALQEGDSYKAIYEQILIESYKTYQQEGASLATEVLQEALGKYPKSNPIAMNCVAHTHIDLAWLWRIKHTKKKGVRSFSTMLKMMDDEEDYYFFQSQPQLYQWVKEEEPELYARIKEKIISGQWEFGGAMWVEADINMSGGESLVRQLLYGQQFYKKEFDKVDGPKFLWLPDVFGYGWSIPQLLRSAGIDYFFTTKLSWNEYNRMPNDTFTWRGIDGSEVRCHFITTPHPYGDRHYVYNALIDAKSLLGTWENYHSKEISKELLVAYGYGDGGGGANIEMIKSIPITNKIPTLPHVRPSTVKDYMKRLDKEVEQAVHPLEVWDHELYLEFHRGTLTVQGPIKKWNRTLENKYRVGEMEASLLAVAHNTYSWYPQDSIQEGYKLLLTNQFHDILPGSSIREVYVDALDDYQKSNQVINKVTEDVIGSLTTEVEDAYTVFNPLHHLGSQLVFLEEGEDYAYVDKNGQGLPSQLTGEGTYVLIDQMAGLTYNNIYTKASTGVSSALSEVNLEKGTLVNDRYRLEWNSFGQLTRIYDCYNQREVLQEGAVGNHLQVFEDKPHGYEAWEIELDTLDDPMKTMESIKDLTEVSIVTNGQLMTTIKFQYSYRTSKVIQYMKVYGHTARIDFETEIDWHEPEKLVKVNFPVNVFAREVTCDTQFGTIKRPTHRTTPWDKAKFEICAINWIDLSQRDYGVSLLNNGKYGHDVHEGNMRISLLKSSIHPDTHADIGKQDFTYSLYPHKDGFLEANTHIEGMILNNPLQGIKGRESNITESLLKLQGKYVEIDAVKKAEESDHIVLRVHEYGGGQELVSITSDYKIEGYSFCNILEEDTEEFVDKEKIEFTIKPYEIKNIKVMFKS